MDNRRPAVMVVDDDEQFRALARLLLPPMAFDVTEAASIGECLDAMQSRSFDAIVLDLVFPDCDGVDALPPIKKIAPRTKVVAVSSAGEASVYLAATARLGADGTLMKANIGYLRNLLSVLLEPLGGGSAGCGNGR